MKTKTIFQAATTTIIATFVLVGITYAATPASNDTSLLNKGTVEIDSLKVGKQGTGGVTFFNGTIINNTTTNGVNNPITFGDNVRIDGKVYRGATAGPGSSPFIINDDTQVDGALVVNGTDVVAAIAGKALASDVYTKTEVDTKVDAKANSTDVYTKTQVDAGLAGKASTTSVDAKANSTDVYTKTESNTLLNSKADSGTVTTNSANIASNTSAITLKANDADVVKKADVVTRYYSVPGSAFSPVNGSIQVGHLDGHIYLTAASGFSDRAEAPVSLPSGANITKVTAFHKTSNTNAPSLVFNRTKYADETVEEVDSQLSFSNTSDLVVATDMPGISSLSPHAYNDQEYMYWLRYDFNTTTTNYLYGVRLEYTITQEK